MTFRPTDDVLDSMENSQQGLDTSNQYNQASSESISDDLNGWNWSKIFSNPDAESDGWNVGGGVSVDLSSQVEEVKAPDLSELLNSDADNKNANKVESNGNNPVDGGSEDFTVDLSEIGNNKWELSWEKDWQIVWSEVASESEWTKLDEFVDSGKMSDKEREQIISWIEWSTHGKMDLLVDNEWKSVVEKYRKIYRIVFRWGVFIFVTILGVIWWIMVQVKANQSGSIKLVWDDTIGNMSSWGDSFSDKVLSSQISKDRGIESIVSYGSGSLNDRSLKSKSNLIKYKWIVLPQLVYLNFNSGDFISLDKFANKETNRKDIENMIEILIMNNEIYQRTLSLPNAVDSRWQWRTFAWWLIDGFGLWCVRSAKIGDFVCDKFLERFYKYGKYYDLSRYSSDVLILARELKNQNKDVKPICDMVKEYVWHSWITSADDVFKSVMSLCTADDSSYYSKMVKFIDIDNSLRQPELLDKTFDDPDLNAYKLLSAQQIVSRTLKNSSINENFIKSYLTFAQNLINKDGWTNKYLEPIYKDMLYVFNKDVLYETLVEKGKESIVKSKLDSLNHGNDVFGYVSLISQLTTPEIVQYEEFVGGTWDEYTLDDVFEKYYEMKDRLQIRKAINLSDTDMQVQTEITSDIINRVTEWLTLKATLLLHKEKNVLYVKSINISNQPSLSETLNIHAKDGKVNFNEMLWYIDQQISFWYKDPKEIQVEFNLCSELENRGDVEVYGCDDSSIILYKWDIEYAFTLVNWIYESFAISDSELDSVLKEKLSTVMSSKENTPLIIQSIIDYELEAPEDADLDKKLEIVDQFRIHLKLVPTVSSIEWEDEVFMVDFSMWNFNFRAHYNINTHLLTKISYVACEKTLEIRNLTIELSTNNDQLVEIINNPRMFFANANPAAYRKYQTMCNKNQ